MKKKTVNYIINNSATFLFLLDSPTSEANLRFIRIWSDLILQSKGCRLEEIVQHTLLYITQVLEKGKIHALINSLICLSNILQIITIEENIAYHFFEQSASHPIERYLDFKFVPADNLFVLLKFALH